MAIARRRRNDLTHDQLRQAAADNEAAEQDRALAMEDLPAGYRSWKEVAAVQTLHRPAARRRALEEIQTAKLSASIKPTPAHAPLKADSPFSSFGYAPLGEGRRGSQRKMSVRVLKVQAALHAQLDQLLTALAAQYGAAWHLPIVVQEVQVTRDLRTAYVRWLPEARVPAAQAEQIQAGLQAKAKQLRHLCGARMKLRHAPELKFFMNSAKTKREDTRPARAASPAAPLPPSIKQAPVGQAAASIDLWGEDSDGDDHQHV